MREKSTYEDIEFKEIAEKIEKKYPRFFHEDFDLDKFYFIRTETIKPKWISRVRKIGHPWGALPGLDRVIYLVETADEHWEPLTEAQRVLTVFHELKHIPEGGCDYDSKECGKLIDHPIQDFPECIAAANGNLFWFQAGHGEDLPNILDTGKSFDLEASLKRAGFIEEEDRKPLVSPEDEDSDEDIAKKMLEDMESRKTDAEIKKIEKDAVIEESAGITDETNEDVAVDEV